MSSKLFFSLSMAGLTTMGPLCGLIAHYLGYQALWGVAVGIYLYNVATQFISVFGSNENGTMTAGSENII